MITFNELVEKVQHALIRKHPKEEILIENIQNILGTLDIARLLHQDPVEDTSAQLQVRRLLLVGQKQLQSDSEPREFHYDRNLYSGTNSWVAGNGAGKSTILKSIVWSLTGEEVSIKPDVKSWLKEVGLEFSLDDKIYTIHYRLREDRPKILGGVYSNSLDEVLSSEPELVRLESFDDAISMKENLAQFFVNQTGFSPLESLKYRKYVIDPKLEAISWGTYALAMFIGADHYDDYLFPYKLTDSDHHLRTLGNYLSINSVEVISKLEVARDRAHSQYEFERKRVEVNAQGVAEEIKHLNSQLVEIENKIKTIEARQSGITDTNFLNTIRQERFHDTTQLLELDRRKEELLREEAKILEEKDKEKRNCQALSEAIQFKKFFSGITVERCPNCDHTIPLVTIEEEINSNHCRVCHNELQFISSVEQHEMLLHQAKKRIELLNQDLRKIKKELSVVDKQDKETEANLSRTETLLGDLPRQERVGLTDELRELLESRGHLQGQLEQLNRQTKESQVQKLQDLKQAWQIYKEAAIELRTTNTNYHLGILKKLESYTNEIVRTFEVSNFERVSITPTFDLTIYQSKQPFNFQRLDTSERIRVKIAFHLALLKLHLIDKIGRHPGLLIVDAPAGAEMDPLRFGGILKTFSDLNEQFGDQIQILIASTNKVLLEICKRNQQEQKDGGEKLF